MTLNTDIYILDKIDPKEVFFQCQALLAQYDYQRRKPEEQKYEEYPDGNWKLPQDITEDDGPRFPGREITDRDGNTRVWVAYPNGSWNRNNEPGQNLCAWLLTDYRMDGKPYTPEEQELAHDKWCDDECDLEDHREQPCWMKVDFNTTYGYSDERGWNCGDLHAALVTQLGLWLNQRGVRWRWRNEYSGEVFDGHEGLETLSAGAVDACAWFENLVKPAIEAHAAAAGGGKVEWS